MHILRVDMTDLQAATEDLHLDWMTIGGRGLSAKILNAEVPARTDPLGKEAKIIFATGPLAGTLAPSCGRLSVGAKSPLSLGIKEANSGGPVGQKIDKLGYRAVVVQGAPLEDRLYVLHVSKDGAAIVPADEYRGLNNYELVKALYQKHDKKASIVSIGTAGERRWKSSTIAFTDRKGLPTRHAARGGFGAVLGSKGIKAIVIDDRGTGPVDIADRKAFKKTVRDLNEAVKADPLAQSIMKYGTPAGIAFYRSLGSAPSKNYSNEQTEGFENLAGEAIEKRNKPRGGSMQGCMPGCIVQCSTTYFGPEGEYITSALEYETLAMLGTNLGVVDPDMVARMDRRCDDMGVDTMEIGSALGVAASAGKMVFGNCESIFALFDELEKGTEFGNILGNGVVSTAKFLGVTRVPAIKGQSIPAHDPRVSKGTGVTFATSPLGADHTAGVSYVKFKEKEGQVRRSLKAQILSAVYDTLGYCALSRISDNRVLMDLLGALINTRYGLNLGIDDIVSLGRQTLRDEIEFNKGSEFHTAHDPYPEFLTKEPLAPIGNVFDVDPEEMKTIWDELDTIQVVKT